MSLALDKRQRAMLREMGVRVWQPSAPVPPLPLPVSPEIAIEVIATSLEPVRAETVFHQDFAPAAIPPTSPIPPVPSMPAPTPAVQIPPAPALPADGDGSPSWRLGEAQPLYAEAASAAALPSGARWLVLVEAPASALAAEPFQGDSGKLLDNMLRAARLHQAGAVLLVPLARLAASSGADLPLMLAPLLATLRPDMVLVMGRLAAQALLQSRLPFAQLRGQVHALHGCPAVVTYDAAFLLRSPADKAKAWADLCLAMSALPVSPEAG